MQPFVIVSLKLSDSHCLLLIQVSVPENEDTLHWCRIFKLPPLDRKHHMIRVRRIFSHQKPVLSQLWPSHFCFPCKSTSRFSQLGANRSSTTWTFTSVWATRAFSRCWPPRKVRDAISRRCRHCFSIATMSSSPGRPVQRYASSSVRTSFVIKIHVFSLFFVPINEKGFTFPSEAGYPMNRAGGAKFFMLETHYDNPNLQSGIVDHSGLRLFYTSQLR